MGFLGVGIVGTLFALELPTVSLRTSVRPGIMQRALADPTSAN